MTKERKEELKDEMKEKISMALKDPILQQGFEVICKENAELKEKFSEEEYKLAEEVIKPIYYNAVKNDYSFAKYGVECYLAGYDKANEWKYPSKGELPKQDGHTCFSIRVLANNKKWVYYSFTENKWYCGNKEVKVTAWKEIVFPKF